LLDTERGLSDGENEEEIIDKQKTLTSDTCRPSSYSTMLAPGHSRVPAMTRCLRSWKLTGVTGSGNVSFLAKTGGTPISFGSMRTSGDITERAA
jgi:hypothetical protein